MQNRKRNRLKNYDYSQDGYYFVTICTKNRECFFGEIKNAEMVLNEYGEIAKKCWGEIPKHFSNVRLDEWVIMPNHVHGIIIIEDESVRDADLRPVQDRSKMYVSKIIHRCKSFITREIRKKYNDYEFAWHKSFYDHIIRNEQALFHIREYIQNNPLKWEGEKDKNHVS